jgi:hypothetical protein
MKTVLMVTVMIALLGCAGVVSTVHSNRILTGEEADNLVRDIGIGIGPKIDQELLKDWTPEQITKLYGAVAASLAGSAWTFHFEVTQVQTTEADAEGQQSADLRATAAKELSGTVGGESGTTTGGGT